MKNDIKRNKRNMKQMILIFIGGGTGSMLRYLISKWLGSAVFPLGTFAVNIIVCFLIGLLGTWIARHSLSPDLRLLLVVGICGGFTTFSTFSNEALTMLRSNQHILCLAYIFLSIAAGLAATFVGAKICNFSS